MKLNHDAPDAAALQGRLLNWKFDSALQYLGDQPQDVCDLVTALAHVMGDCGWISSDLGNIVAWSIAPLIEETEEETS